MTGWHKESVHPMLRKYGGRFNFSLNDNENGQQQQMKVLVPLCGKTVDMHFLAKQDSVSQVFGVDGVIKALTEFSDENPELEIKAVNELTKTGSYQQLVGNSISLLKGDFFALNEDDSDGKVDAVWDRASMVAIKPTLRKFYVETIGRVVKPGGSILLVTFDRRVGTDEAKSAGPPFSINEEEVRNLYNLPWVESIELLEEVNEFDANPGSRDRWEKQGLSEMFEICFLIKVKSSDSKKEL